MAVVLIVDDEFGIADVLSAMLEDEGHRVLSAINGRAALERMAEELPDLVISDYMMPVMDGAALLARMAAEPRLANVPVALMSSMSEDTIAEHCRGYVAFMRKPFRMNDVFALVSRILPSPGQPAAVE
ncbi:response regulator [Novosphingobium sp. 9U]|uniref:response regulator n=1 Tax=Novosphingobium sp. 9U TaxID=2653158 RepID=UPI0012EEF163|nr:response regulator [Novosphingobium sp. 9U]VWX48322.1 Response regulator [Novosphingobium sp. 9U]